MSLNRSRLLEAQDKRDLVEVSQLIDLTDKPIGLTRDEIGWSKVKSSASNCLCCCSNNSITLVTTEDSYILDHVPLDNIQFAQANSNLQYLALSNHRKLVVIDLVDGSDECDFLSKSTKLAKETKIVNLAAYGLTMSDIVFWRWIEENVLAILSKEALYTCAVDQRQINHPALSALSIVSKNLPMEKVFDCHPHLASFCQVTEIQRNSTGNLYAISSLYSTPNLFKLNSPSNTRQSHTTTRVSHNLGATLRTTLKPSFGSVPCRLSQLELGGQHQSFERLKTEYLFEPHDQILNKNENVISGLVQIYCRIRNCSQLIQAHAVTYTSTSLPTSSQLTKEDPFKILFGGSNDELKESTILVAANKIGNTMRVHFIEMANGDYLPSASQNASPSVEFNQLTDIDFPTSIVCSHVHSSSGTQLHVALITTKHGQLFVCSVTHSTILFNLTITKDIICSTVLESKTRGLMVICRNGQVLLVKLNLGKLMRLLDESKSLRHISSTPNIFSSSRSRNSFRADMKQPILKADFSVEKANKELHHEVDSEVLMSTRL